MRFFHIFLFIFFLFLSFSSSLIESTRISINVEISPDRPIRENENSIDSELNSFAIPKAQPRHSALESIQRPKAEAERVPDETPVPKPTKIVYPPLQPGEKLNLKLGVSENREFIYGPSPIDGSMILKPAVENTDPFRPEIYLDRGLFKGQWAQTTDRYSIKYLTPEQIAERKIPHQPDDIIFANFYHKGQFWIAKMSPNSVQQVRSVTSYFGRYIGHQMARFILSKPIELFPQTPDQKPLKNMKVSDIITTNESVFTINEQTRKLQPYEPFGSGIKDAFPVAFRVVSFGERAKTWGKQNQPRITENILKLTSEENNLLLKKALDVSDESGMKQMYHTIKDSCSTTFYLKTLDPVIQQTRGAKRNLWDKFLHLFRGGLNPAFQTHYLNMRKIENEPSEQFYSNLPVKNSKYLPFVEKANLMLGNPVKN